METAYICHEMSADSKEKLTGVGHGLTPVETVDMVDGGKPNREPVKSTQSDSVAENSEHVPDTSAKEKQAKNSKAKFPFGVEEVDAAVQKVLEVVKKLHSCDDYTSKMCSEDLTFLRQLALLPARYSNLKLQCFDAVADHDITRIFKAVMEQNLKLPFDTPNYKTSYDNMRSIIVLNWNGTDASRKLCDRMMEQGVYVDILDYLSGEVLRPQDTETSNKIYCAKGLLGILHNLCQKCTNARTLLRENNAVEVVQVYRNSKNDMLKSKSLMVLVHIINDKENDMINSDDQPIQFMLAILKDTLNSKEHVSKKYGYRANEIMEVLNRLAGSDSNKIKLVNHGALQYYAKLLESSCSTEEQALSAKGLWTLAFKSKDAILSNPECMQGLKYLAEHSKDKDVLSQVRGALWILEGRDQEEEKKGTKENLYLSRPTEESSAPSHIMISYQWGSKPTMLRIKDYLKENGYKVWMDEVNMEGNILDAMAEAVEKAKVVLVCMSQKYKDSPNCRTEAEYAFKLRKKIIPLKLQYKYDPDGWLGIIVGAKLYFDFSEENRYEKSTKGLLKELGGKMETAEQQAGQSVTPAYVEETMTNAPRPFIAAKQELEKWNQDKVKSWLEENNMAKYKEKFSEFDGALLLEYKLMMKNAPDFFFTSLRDTLKLPLVDILKFSSSLRKI